MTSELPCQGNRNQIFSTISNPSRHCAAMILGPPAADISHQLYEVSIVAEGASYGGLAYSGNIYEVPSLPVGTSIIRPQDSIEDVQDGRRQADKATHSSSNTLCSCMHTHARTWGSLPQAGNIFSTSMWDLLPIHTVTGY